MPVLRQDAYLLKEVLSVGKFRTPHQRNQAPRKAYEALLEAYSELDYAEYYNILVLREGFI